MDKNLSGDFVDFPIFVITISKAFLILLIELESGSEMLLPMWSVEKSSLSDVVAFCGSEMVEFSTEPSMFNISVLSRSSEVELFLNVWVERVNKL